jgi:opacity protein-like surface antigen
MKSIFFIVIYLCVSLKPADSFSQEFKSDIGSYDFAIRVSGNFISSASIQLNPYSQNIVEKNSFSHLGSGFGYGISISKKFFRNDLSLILSTEYVKINDKNVSATLVNGSNAVKVNVTESLWMVPVELSLNFNLPKMAQKLNIFIGGGLGVYFGDRKRTIASTSTETIESTPMLNLHIMTGMEYSINEKLSGVFEMKFRDAGFKVQNTFPYAFIGVNGRSYPVPTEYNSKVFVDGMKLSVGLNYYIF